MRSKTLSTVSLAKGHATNRVIQWRFVPSVREVILDHAIVPQDMDMVSSKDLLLLQTPKALGNRLFSAIEAAEEYTGGLANRVRNTVPSVSSSSSAV
jgi:hypothetical protein